MKDKAQIVIIILLVLNLAFVIIFGIGQQNLKKEIQNVQMMEYNNLKLFASDINTQLEATLLKDKFKVLSSEVELSDYHDENGMVSGVINFQMTDNEGIEKLSIIVEEIQTGETTEYGVIKKSDLNYEAGIKIAYNGSYYYYVLGDTSDGTNVMLSDRYYLSGLELMKTRSQLSLNELSITQNAFYIEGAILNRKDAPEIEKAEVLIVSFLGTDPTVPEEINEDDIAGRFDITDSLQKLDEISAVSAYGNEISDEYDVYEIDVRGKADEGTNYMAKEFVEAIIIVTYSDGVEIRLG
ncbi:MAG: hypothetical protein JXN65_10300 [Clostridia bacterium]|nr:hypothetical protein [Clostridia bacterium]